jgi:hypothetical protein
MRIGQIEKWDLTDIAMPTKPTAAHSTDTKKKSRIGSDFENFLKEQGRLEEFSALAMKRVLAVGFSEPQKCLKPKSNLLGQDHMQTHQ